MMCNIGAHLLTFPETLLNTAQGFIGFDQSVQLHEARYIHAKIGQEFIISHVRSIMERLLPIADPFLKQVS